VYRFYFRCVSISSVGYNTVQKASRFRCCNFGTLFIHAFLFPRPTSSCVDVCRLANTIVRHSNGIGMVLFENTPSPSCEHFTLFLLTISIAFRQAKTYPSLTHRASPSQRIPVAPASPCTGITRRRLKIGWIAGLTGPSLSCTARSDQTPKAVAAAQHYNSISTDWEISRTIGKGSTVAGSFWGNGDPHLGSLLFCFHA
jgi:hypothetical protein